MVEAIKQSRAGEPDRRVVITEDGDVLVGEQIDLELAHREQRNASGRQREAV